VTIPKAFLYLLLQVKSFGDRKSRRSIKIQPCSERGHIIAREKRTRRNRIKNNVEKVEGSKEEEEGEVKSKRSKKQRKIRQEGQAGD
jgi:hypothetical protein